MEANFDNTADQARATGRRVKNDLSDGISDIKSAASGEIKNLISDVEDLMARIADLKDADVVRVRGKVQRAVEATKQSLSDSADSRCLCSFYIGTTQMPFHAAPRNRCRSRRFWWYGPRWSPGW